MSKLCYVLAKNIPSGDLERLGKALHNNSFQVTVLFNEQVATVLSKAVTKVEFRKSTNFCQELNEINQASNKGYVQVIIIGDKPQSFNKISVDSNAFLRFFATKFHRVALYLEPSNLTDLLDKHSDLLTTVEERKQLSVKALQLFSHYDNQLASGILNNEVVIGKKVLVIGSGGREHAIVHKIAQSDKVDRVFTAPGNSGTASDNPKCMNVDISSDNISELVKFALHSGIDLVFVGPEQPLVDGIVDAMHAHNIPCFGPSQSASIIEASKAWSKDFMARHNLPTASYRNFTSFPEAQAYIESLSYRVVIKASGLAAGKGVLIPQSTAEAVEFARYILQDAPFGSVASNEIVVEQYLEGQEISILAFSDGKLAKGMPAAQDHKRIYDHDEGPNTGGMGAYAPSPLITPKQYTACMELIQKSVTAMAAEDKAFVGVLYTGFILTQEYGPMILEYNCRFGDPETQVLLPLLQTDLYEICMACLAGNLVNCDINWSEGYACTVVCAAKGYPESYPKGDIITGLSHTEDHGEGKVYHAGAKVHAMSQQVVTNGGRVLTVTATANSLQSAVNKAYKRIESIHFDGMQYRKDIAQRALRRPLRVGVLGSTRGSSLQPILDAIQAQTLQNIEISLIISNKATSGILERGKTHHIPTLYISPKDLTRESYDTLVCEALEEAGVDVVLMIGYMRIVSQVMTSRFPLRMINVHPSLLPDFAGGMDLAVHEAVLAAGKEESGCTVHYVTEEVDGGPIVIQRRCSVNKENDTAESLKAKVQALEGKAFIEALEWMQRDGVEGVAEAVLARQSRPTLTCPGSPAPRITSSTPRYNYTTPHKPVPEVLTYRDAGVDIDAGEELVERIKPYCKATRRAGCDAELGGFGGLFDLTAAGFGPGSDTILVSGTDGVGTKLKIAQELGKHDTIGIDLVAMCVNDVLVCGAEPLFFLDYYATGRLEVAEAADVVKGIAQGCLLGSSALIGGETAEMAGMYAPGEYDLAGFSVGAVRKPDILPQGIAAGDVLIGLSSSGVHSNGYSLVRKCVAKSGLQYTDPVPFATSAPNMTLGEALLTPTRIYVSDLMPLIKAHLIKGMAHITGGGLLDNLPRVLPSNVIAKVNLHKSQWKLPPVFQWLQSIANLPQHELLRTFNCGIGMVVVVGADKVQEVFQMLTASTPSGFQPPIILGELAIREDHHTEQVVVEGELA